MSISGAVFLVVFFAGIALTLLRKPVYGLYTYVAVFYLHPPSRWWGETLPDLRWSLLAALVTLVASWRLPLVPGRLLWLKTTPAIALLLFVIWFWIQNIWALAPIDHLEASWLFTKYVLLYYLIYRLIISPEDVAKFLMVHVAGCAYLGWLAFNTNVSGRLEGVGGPGIDEANAFAMQMSTGVLAGAMFAVVLAGWRRWMAVAALPFILNGVILSGSRGGFLALVCGGLMLWWLKPAAHRKVFYAFAALGVLLFGMLASSMFWDRMQTMEVVVDSGEQEMDTSAESRIALAYAQMQMVKDYPLGAGHRGTAILSPLYLDNKFLTGVPGSDVRRRSSHNTFLSALVEQGIPGGIWFAWVWGWVFVTVKGIKRSLGRSPAMEETLRRMVLASVAASLGCFFVAALFVDYLKAEILVWLLALLASQRAAPVTQAQPASGLGVAKMRRRVAV